MTGLAADVDSAPFGRMTHVEKGDFDRKFDFRTLEGFANVCRKTERLAFEPRMERATRREDCVRRDRDMVIVEVEKLS